MLTSLPLAVNPLARAAVNVASPHGVGGYVLRMPNRGAVEKCWRTEGYANDGRVDWVLTVIPTGGCYLRVQRERMLGAVSSDKGATDSSRTSWVPNYLNDTPAPFRGAFPVDPAACWAGISGAERTMGHSAHTGGRR